ncbi:MAG TPA: DUF2461 domain-containing protein [Flavipsychrobacter sp.]|nr:DUF2461 domain-containing protein [Flavipsychrobacter sp.]
MLQPSTIKFLETLSQNNDKTWFDAHRDEYAEAKQDFENFVTTLLDKICELEPELRNQKAKDCIFRIFRDVRFSKDKTPYKSHFGVYFSKGGRKYEGAGYYLHIEPGGKSFAGGGLWMPEPALLKKVRQEIDYNFEEFQKILQEKSFKKFFKELEGEKLKTLPQGYATDNPAIEFLKMKGFTAGNYLKDEVLTKKDFANKCLEIFTAMKPLVDFLNRAMN